MSAFRIQPRGHASLQDWVALEKGYFEKEGLDTIDFVKPHFPSAAPKGDTIPAQKTGAFHAAIADPSKRDDEAQRSNVNTFCHWAVNMAVHGGHGKMWPHAYSWTVSGLYVPPDSDIHTPEDLAGVPIAVGLNSGSHFSTVLSLEKYIPREKINLQFVGGPNVRMGLLLEGRVQAANGLGCPCHIFEQNGYRKIIDNSFIQGFLISGDVERKTAEAYFRAVKRAQQDIDVDMEPYKHYLLEHSIPQEYHRYVKNPAGLGAPTRIVFEDYTRDMYEATRAWMDTYDFFDASTRQSASTRYEEAMLL